MTKFASQHDRGKILIENIISRNFPPDCMLFNSSFIFCCQPVVPVNVIFRVFFKDSFTLSDNEPAELLKCTKISNKKFRENLQFEGASLFVSVLRLREALFSPNLPFSQSLQLAIGRERKRTRNETQNKGYQSFPLTLKMK